MPQEHLFVSVFVSAFLSESWREEVDLKLDPETTLAKFTSAYLPILSRESARKGEVDTANEKHTKLFFRAPLPLKYLRPGEISFSPLGIHHM